MEQADTTQIVETEREEVSCGFCLQKPSYMTTPKRLPCSHVFCLPCLEADLTVDKECPVCRYAVVTKFS